MNRKWPGPPAHIPHPVRLKSCMRCKGDLSWRADEDRWACLQCGWREDGIIRRVE